MANEMEWVKLSTNIFESRKMRYLSKCADGDKMQLMWVKLIVLAGQCGTSGELWLSANKPYHYEDLAIEFGYDKDFVETVIDLFLDLDMLEWTGTCADDGAFKICGWEEHQSVEKIEQKREQARERKRKQRAREQSTSINDGVTPMSRSCHANVTPVSHDVTLQSRVRVESKSRESVSCNNLSHATGDAPSAPAGCSPTIDEVKSFFSAEKLKGNPDLFFATYDATGWLDAHGNVIANWKSLAKKWSINEKKFADTSEPEHLSADELENQLAEVEQQLSELADVPEVSGASMSREQFSKHQLKIRRDTLREKLRKAG